MCTWLRRGRSSGGPSSRARDALGDLILGVAEDLAEKEAESSPESSRPRDTTLEVEASEPPAVSIENGRKEREGEKKKMDG